MLLWLIDWLVDLRAYTARSEVRFDFRCAPLDMLTSTAVVAAAWARSFGAENRVQQLVAVFQQLFMVEKLALPGPGRASESLSVHLLHLLVYR